MKKTNALLALALTGVMLLSACGGAATPAEAPPAEPAPAPAAATPSPEPIIPPPSAAPAEPAPVADDQFGGIIKPVITSDALTLDPVKASSSNDQIPGIHIFETALTADTSGAPHPGACTYEVTNDGKSLVLTVREGLTFHNGSPVTGADLESSATRWFNNFAFAKTYVGDKLESMTVDGNTLTMNFAQPNPLVFVAITNWDHGFYVVPKEINDKYPDSNIPDAECIGTGPYMFTEHMADRYVLLDKYPAYIPAESEGDGFAAPRIGYADQLQFFVSSDKAATLNGVQTGEYDTCVNVPANMIPNMQADPNLSVESRALEIFPTMHFNCAEGPATDINLRNAIISCLDMEELMLAAQGDPSLYILNPSCMPASSMWAIDESLGKYNTVDIEKAKEYLAQSSYNGEALRFCTTRDNDYFYKTAMVVADMCKEVGINIDVQVYDNATLREYRMDPTKFDIFSGGLTSKPDPTLLSFFENGWAGFYASEQKDALVAEMAVEMDTAARMELWTELTKVIYTDLPVITFGERTNAIVYNKRLNDVFTTSQQIYWNTWVTE